MHVDSGQAVFTTPALKLALTSTVPVEVAGQDVWSLFKLREGESAVFALDRITDEVAPRFCAVTEAERDFKATVRYWRHWLSQSRYRGRWREMVHRSALTLKLLTYAPTGAIIAAPTTSLPERIGGERNWDYRYVWIRDAAFCVYALLRLGFTDEAEAFMGFLSEHVQTGIPEDIGPDGPLQIMYGIDGRRDLPERELTHLEGYRGSAPVRIGNGAVGQLQLDIYGALVDCLYLYDKWGSPCPAGTGTTSAGWSTGCASTGTSPTRECGRPAEAVSPSSTPASCAGLPSNVPCGWPGTVACPPTCCAGAKPATRSTSGS